MSRTKPLSRARAPHKGRLHAMALEWLMDRANPESDGGLGVFADSRYCTELTKLLERVERSALRRRSR
jgi:hypothetical protein